MRAYIEGFKDCTIAETTVTLRTAMKPADVEQLEKLAEELRG